MEKRKLGKTDISVSKIAFGCVEIGMPYGIGVKSKDEMIPENEAVKLLNKALDSGINFFDTARMYGNSEQIIGKAFKKKRNEVVICTKCRHFRDSNGKLPEKSKIKDYIEQSLSQSLKMLQTDFVDIFMLHQVDIEILENDEIANTFHKLKRKGIIKATGVSTYTVEETNLAIDLGIWDVIQLPFNLMDQRHEVLFKKAQEKGIGMVVRSILLKGLLSNHGQNLHPALKDVENHISKLTELSEQINHSLPAFAIKFGLSFPEISSVLIGIDKDSYLEHAVDIANSISLTLLELKKAKKLAYPDPGFLNLSYWSKMNWLK